MGAMVKRSAAMDSSRQHAGARFRRAWAWHPRPFRSHHIKCNEVLPRRRGLGHGEAIADGGVVLATEPSHKVDLGHVHRSVRQQELIGDVKAENLTDADVGRKRSIADRDDLYEFAFQVYR